MLDTTGVVETDAVESFVVARGAAGEKWPDGEIEALVRRTDALSPRRCFGGVVSSAIAIGSLGSAEGEEG